MLLDSPYTYGFLGYKYIKQSDQPSTGNLKPAIMGSPVVAFFPFLFWGFCVKAEHYKEKRTLVIKG